MYIIRFFYEKPAMKPAKTDFLEPKNIINGMQFDLSFNQEAQYVNYKLNPKETNYILPCLLKLEGKIDTNLLEESFRFIVERHASLRTIIMTDDEGNAKQIIRDKIVFEFHEKRFKNEKKLIHYLSQKAKKPFDIEKDNLCQGALYKVSESSHNYLYLRFHYLIIDVYSQVVFFKELSECYAALCENRHPEIPKLKLSYHEYARQQRQLWEHQVTQNLSYWKNEVGSVPYLNLPVEDVTGEESTSEQVKNFNEILGKKIERHETLATGNKTNALLAAYFILLYKYTGSEEIVVGFPDSGRKSDETNSLIGNLTKHLPIKVSFNDGLTVEDIIQSVDDALCQGRKHDDISPSTLYAGLSGYRIGNPVFQTSFNISINPETRFEISNVTIKNLSRELGIFNVLYDLEFSYNGYPDHRIVVQYKSNLFEKRTIEKMLSHYTNTLDIVLDSPGKKVDEIDILTSEERQYLIQDLNNTDDVQQRESCIHHLFEEQAIKYPESIALKSVDRTLKYGELNSQANKLANKLLECKPPGHLIPIICNRTSQYIVSILGILKAGFGYIPLDDKIPRNRIEKILEECGSSIVVSDSQLTPYPVEKVIEIDNILSDPAISDKNPNVQIPPSAVAYTIYTSGSTGNPKGVVITHQAIVNYTLGACERLELPEKSQYAHVSTLTADLGLTMLFSSFHKFSTLHLIDDNYFLNPEKFSQYIKNERIDCLKITPSHFNSLLYCENPKEAIPRKKLIFGGESLSWDLVEKVNTLNRQVDIYNHYGPSESTVGIHAWKVRMDQRRQNRSVGLGFPMKNIKSYVMLNEKTAAPVGIPGELMVSGKNLSEGYLNRSDLTSERFINNPFETDDPYKKVYRTGDLVKRLPDGNVEFLGRIDHQVKIRGYRVELEEIETVLNRLGDIEQSIVLASNDKLYAFFTSQKENYQTQDIAPVLRKKLPDYMIPAYTIQLDKFPLTSNGKIDRKSIAIPEERQLNTGIDDAKPETQEEIMLCTILKDLLKTDDININSSYSDLGGDSLMAMKLVFILKKRGIKGDYIKDILSGYTIQQIAKKISLGGNVIEIRNINDI